MNQQKGKLSIKILRKVRSAAAQVNTEAWKQAKAASHTGLYL